MYAHCATVAGAAHFVFHAASSLCSCPPKGAAAREAGPDFIGGAIACKDLVNRWGWAG
ncbi:unnamed protein product [Effrenium voratum]|nr:unnamed protein product [Effrenium voratum]